MASISSENSKLRLPQVDLSGLGRVQYGTEAWARAQSEVATALATYGGFEAVFDDADAELQSVLFGRAMPELFKEEAKHSSAPLISRSGFWFLEIPGAFKSLQLDGPECLQNVRDFAATIWPHGNDFFSNTICGFAKYLQALEQTLQKMIFASFGLEAYYSTHVDSMAYSMRLAEYFAKERVDETETRIPVHVDPNYITIIFQNNVEGLEIESPDGAWMRAAPLPTSFTVLLGEAFMAWTNGRFRAPKHRVKMEDATKRYSVIFSSLPSPADDTVKTLDELVDGKHPQIYNPFKYYDYLNFRLSAKDKENALKSFCGVEREKAVA